MQLSSMLDIISVETDIELPEETFTYLCGLVSKAKRERVGRFRHRKDAVNTLMGEIITRNMISARAGLSFGEIEIKPDQHGKPLASSVPGVHFNVSHSGNMVVCAVSNHPVGVDVEFIRSAKPGIAERFFCEDECLHISSSTDSPDAAFFQIWTMKESYIKWNGKGLAASLDSFSVLEIQQQGHPVFHSVDVHQNAICHICAEVHHISSFRKYKLSDYLTATNHAIE